MGMIARVRRRVRINSVTVDRERTAQTVCLLSTVLLLPYCPRGPLPLLPSPAPLLYSLFVLPIVFSANYKYPISALKTIGNFAKDLAGRMRNPLRSFCGRFYQPIDRAENLFLEMNNISVMANQIVFFILADRIFLPRTKTSCLYTLMFYNVIAYCVGYVKELIEKEDWSPYVTLTERSRIKHLAMSATKIVLEWTKAVTFVVTLTFVFLAIALEQGLENYRPSISYTTITWIYYAATEKIFVRMFPALLSIVQLQILENMEELYSPVILRSFTIAASALFILISIPTAPWRFLSIACYLNVYLGAKELTRNSAATLCRERETLNRYRPATSEEIERFDDVCAVCLCTMTRARITPCRHLFHASCLRQCLKTSDVCPICKRELKFD